MCSLCFLVHGHAEGVVQAVLGHEHLPLVVQLVSCGLILKQVWLVMLLSSQTHVIVNFKIYRALYISLYIYIL